jgi:hypothetical protein
MLNTTLAHTTINGFFIFTQLTIFRIVIDTKKFTPNQAMDNGFLWIYEQTPGPYFYAQDVTEYVALGYWPSYNRPFFGAVFDLLGYTFYEKM